MTRGWTVVIPVKGAAGGKSRLVVPDIAREALARAIALDTIWAAAACDAVGEVVVVTADAEVAASLPSGARTVDDPGTGLDAAVAAGVASARDGMPRAALLGDLPSLRPHDLAAALVAAGDHPRSVVADAEGTGSTLVTAAAGIAWSSAFGDGSFARHRALGCVALAIPDASSVRRDVDTAAQLHAAATLGLGPRTAALLTVTDD